MIYLVRRDRDYDLEYIPDDHTLQLLSASRDYPEWEIYILHGVDPNPNVLLERSK